MLELGRGAVSKMQVALGEPAQYHFRLDDQLHELNGFIGKDLRLEFLGEINCTHCDRQTKKSYAQGYCWPCFKALARCDTCIMSPEKCHYDAGTCREPEWAQQYCMTDHFVYLANSTGVKVGITRGNQVPTRWLDQGAVQALPIFRVATRQQSGFVEDVLRSQVNDRTNWRALLRGDVEPVDLVERREHLLDSCAQQLQILQQRFGLQAIQPISGVDVIEISYPVESYPSKITSFNLDKEPVAEGTLIGIKGQYLLFDTGVINIRKYTAYQLALSVNDSVAV
ncbi:DUF2797 domain-containing protein [Denitrificimonas sp. JX-1]|uniref:DUF2797 domain-containing protein n=1 Tax=Denitrificimonas halotolerans TaxID=3098930 RepID=A0ABU5GRN2_9GAMM|nr:DUF2797 domain-containing protein [Denitrificimonas sp. JX-1]MDY7218866.1 DUF2797 domain-containing protein [Denitrificimonas sp. JX-1]